MCLKSSLSFPFIVLLFFYCSVQGQNTTHTTVVSTSVSLTVATTTSLETGKPSCDGGQINPPNCTQCAANYETKDGKCFEIKSEIKPSRGIGRRVFLILFACLLTIVLLLAMLVVYGRLNQQRRRRLSSNPGNISDSSNIGNRFNNILRTIGLNKRGRFNFFSISNNNPSGGQYRQPDTSRAHLNENPDEALLFDDPYADGGLNNSSVNPYKSLTLAVT